MNSVLIQALMVLLFNVFFVGKPWLEAVKEFLESMSVKFGGRDAVEDALMKMSSNVGARPDYDEVVDLPENVGKFGDGTFINFLKTIDWAKFATFILTIINMIPKADPAPDGGPVE